MTGEGAAEALRLPFRQWTTEPAAAHEQFGLWQDAVDRAFVPVDLRRRGAQDRTASPGFTSDVAVWAMGPAELSVMASGAQVVRRTPAQVAAGDAGVCFVNLPLDAGATVTQSGRVARLRAGDLVVVDGDVPFELDFARGFRQISLKLPREVLQRRLGDVPGRTALRLDGGAGLGAVAAAAIRAAASTASTLDRRGARGLTDELVALLALALREAPAGPDPTPTARLLTAARTEVERSLDDPGLTPSVVAARVGVSVRHLHAVFSAQGPTFGRYLLLRRLERCHDDLTDPQRSHWTIGQVAASHGFADASHFARVFRARYGASPGQVRRRD